MIPGFDIEHPIGRGGYAEIVAARRVHDGRAAAIKIGNALSPRGQLHLAREAAALRAVGPALAPEVLAAGALEDGTPWIALERFINPSLASRLRARGGPLPIEEFRTASLAVAGTLDRLHSAGWCHLDLKPGHVFVDGAAARLVDFGLAEGPPGMVEAPPTQTGGAGSAAYMSPEQVRGSRADYRSDVYASGVILYELVTGRTPFLGTPGEVRQAHLALRPPRPAEYAPVSSEVEAVILRCLAKDPQARYPDGRALRMALGDALDKAPSVRVMPGRATDMRLQRRTVAVVDLESDADLLGLTRTLGAMGARFVRQIGNRHTFVFEPGARENAVRLAVDGMQAVLGTGLAPRALVDLSSLQAIETPAGPRYMLPASRTGLPSAAPRGITLTPAAAATVPEVSVSPCPELTGTLRVVPRTDATVPSIPLIGRDPTLSHLVGIAREALASSTPSVTAVLGDAGMGKTRLGAALSERLRTLVSAPDVVELRARDGVLGGDETLRALLAWALDVQPDSVPPDGGRSVLPALIPHIPAQDGWAPFALTLGWIHPDDPALRMWRAAPGALRAAAVRGVGEALRARARARPLCILVDDAHLADTAALDALEYAALAEAAIPLFVCALGRPALQAARPGLGDRAARSSSLDLPPLAPEDGGELCRRLLLPAENVPSRAIERLVERSHGIPILLVELVRGLRAQGLVRQRGDGHWYVATEELERLPDLPLVDWLAQREMAGLPEALAAHARLIALLADEVGSAEVAGAVAELDREGMSSGSALDPDVGTRRLVEIRVLIQRDDRVTFRHPLLREAVARSASEQERRAVHRAAFRYYLLAAHLPQGERLQRLAVHAEACGLRAEAASLWLRIAESLRARHAYLEAEIHFTRALAQLAEDDARGRFVALRGRGTVRYRLGRYQDAISDLAAAEARARGLDDRAGQITCLLDEATALDWMNDYNGSSERVTVAQRLAAQGVSPLDAARLELARARTLFRAARFNEAVVALEAAATFAEPLGDEGYETLVVALLLLGPLLPNLGRAEEARAAIDRAMALASAHGDPLHLASALNNRRNLWVALGTLDPALEDQRAFLRIGRDLGMVGIEYVGQFNLGELLYQARNLSDAGLHVTRAVDLERRHPEVASSPVARLLQARLHAYGGDLAAARDWMGEVRKCEAGAREVDNRGALLGPSDRILAEAVDLVVAGEGPERWTDLCVRSRGISVEQEPIEIRELHGLTALRAGRIDEAGVALREALALTDRIPNLMRARVEASLALLPRIP